MPGDRTLQEHPNPPALVVGIGLDAQLPKNLQFKVNFLIWALILRSARLHSGALELNPQENSGEFKGEMKGCIRCE
jgi:hypothetical protein